MGVKLDLKPNMGSSPRMRGKRFDRPIINPPRRLIPAHAGKTTDAATITLAAPAHPRACGENSITTQRTCLTAGSSPRMRGKRSVEHFDGRHCRLIPAHAGKTVFSSIFEPPSPAHPRACGENSGISLKLSFQEGSSPRMRGKHGRGYPPQKHARLIPAHAGKTLWSDRWQPYLGAHPRACGENNIEQDWLSFTRGSSPRMRGKRAVSSAPLGTARLIPAHAGKTAVGSLCHQCHPAHPRACGENADLLASYLPDAGSSPRMRGKPLGCLMHGALNGLIPAHAGKTALFPVSESNQAAHPRACGENMFLPELLPIHRAHPRACGENLGMGKSTAYRAGSSPRMRGKRE